MSEPQQPEDLADDSEPDDSEPEQQRAAPGHRFANITEDQLVDAAAKAQRRPRPAPEQRADQGGEGDDVSLGYCPHFCAVFVALIAALAYYLTPATLPGELLKVTDLTNDQIFRTVVRPEPGQGMRGPNGKDTDWAIFFYKPYCGAHLSPLPSAALLHSLALPQARAGACGRSSARSATRSTGRAGCASARWTASGGAASAP